MTLSISCKERGRELYRAHCGHQHQNPKIQYQQKSNIIIFVSNLNFPTFLKKKVIIIQPSTQTFQGLHHRFIGKLQAHVIQNARSLFFSSDLVRAVHTHGRGKAARRAKRGHAHGHTRGHLRVSRVLLDGLRKKSGCSQSMRYKATGISAWEDSLYPFTGHILQVTCTGHCFIDSLVNQVICPHLKITFWIRIRARRRTQFCLIISSTVTCILTCGM